MRWKGANQYLVGITMIVALALPAQSQNRLPQEYFSADEIITLAPDMSFEEAFLILSELSDKKEGRIIIDPLKRQGQIGIAITNLPWKKAFEVILKVHNLRYVAHEKFYEVVGEVQAEEPGKEKISLLSREIRIEAIFFEADRGKLAEAGIDWTFIGAGTKWWGGDFGVKGANEVSSEIVEGNVSYGSSKDNVSYTVTGMLRTFEADNLGRIIAQPQVVVLSGKEGRIQVGQDFSIKTRDFAGNIIDNFFSTGTILTVTPIVHVENDMTFIHLNIHAERSTAIPDPVSTTINKSQAETQVLLANGECTMVGGLYTREMTTLRRGVPYLKDLPWWALGLKYLFGYNKKETKDKELIVILRASLLPEMKGRIGQPGQSLDKTFDEGYDQSGQDFEKTWDTLKDKK